VVLPVVARKRGLDGHYEQAGGNLQLKRANERIEPVGIVHLNSMTPLLQIYIFLGTWYVWLRPFQVPATS